LVTDLLGSDHVTVWGIQKDEKGLKGNTSPRTRAVESGIRDVEK